MKKVLIFFILLIPLTVYSDIVEDLIKKADSLYEERAKEGKAEEAIKVYQKVIAINPVKEEAYWKMARTYYWIGTHKKSDSESAEVFKEAIEWAKRGVQINEKSAPSHFWLGVSYGKFGEARGILQSLHLVPYFKKEMEKVLEIEPNYEEGGAYRALGRLYYKLPSFKGGSNEKAIEYLKKGCEVGPKHLLNYLWLAEVYIAEGRKELAKKELEFVINAPYQPHRKPENEEEKQEAKRMLEKLQ